MSAGARIAAFFAALILVFEGAALAGGAYLAWAAAVGAAGCGRCAAAA